MNDVCAELHLGPEAVSYIRDCLANGKTLARYLLQRPDLESGTVTTFLPSDVGKEAATQFKWGGKLRRDPATFVYRTEPDGSRTRWEPVPNTDPWLVSIIQAFLRAAEDRVCIFENALARPSDPVLSRSESRVLVFDNEVYHFLSAADWASTIIAQAIREAGCPYPPLIGAMASAADEAGFSGEGRQISSAQLKVLAERTEKIVIGAYDGEGYLIWSKPAS